MLHDLLLESTDLLPKLDHDRGQLAVLALENLDFVFETGNPLQLAPATLGGSDAVPLPLALQLNALLVLHINRGQGRRAAHRSPTRWLLLHTDLKNKNTTKHLIKQSITRLTITI